MSKQTDKLIRFFKNECIDVKNFEKDAGIPARTISHAIAGYKALPEKHVDAITQHLKVIASQRLKSVKQIDKLVKAIN